jgi:hypothetical protein
VEFAGCRVWYSSILYGIQYKHKYGRTFFVLAIYILDSHAIVFGKEIK